MKFDVNGKFMVSFDPTDEEFANNIFSAVVELDQQYCVYKTRVLTSAKRGRYEITKETASLMCKCIQNAVKYPVCDELLDDPASLLFLADGTPIWFNIIYGYLEKIEVPRPWYCNKVVSKYIKKRKCGDCG